VVNDLVRDVTQLAVVELDEAPQDSRRVAFVEVLSRIRMPIAMLMRRFVTSAVRSWATSSVGLGPLERSSSPVPVKWSSCRSPRDVFRLVNVIGLLSHGVWVGKCIAEAG